MSARVKDHPRLKIDADVLLSKIYLFVYLGDMGSLSGGADEMREGECALLIIQTATLQSLFLHFISDMQAFLLVAFLCPNPGKLAEVKLLLQWLHLGWDRT